MGKQIFNFIGMNRDISPSKLNNKYAYEIRNLRITAQEDSTYLDLTTEKGNKKYYLFNIGSSVEIEGTVIGYCILNNYITIFTHETGEYIDHIYRLEEGTEQDVDYVEYYPVMLFNEIYSGDLGFIANEDEDGNILPLETIGIYENENIQKIYWIDGVHQPRVINIAPSAVGTGYDSNTSFDFMKEMQLKEVCSVEKLTNFIGMFNSGVIQYACTYSDRNGVESPVFYLSPINYISALDKGLSPEEKSLNTCFKINVSNIDSKYINNDIIDTYQYINIYSIFKSSINGTPICKRLPRINLNTATIDYIYNYKGVQLSSVDTTYTSNSYIDVSLGDLYVFTTKGTDNVIVPIKNYISHRVEKLTTYEIDSSSYIIKITDSSDPTSLIADVWDVNDVNNDRHVFVYNIDYPDKLQTLREEDVYTSVNILRLDVIDINKSITFIDNGMIGETCDYAQILYAGGNKVVPQTFEQKNNTLFLGNYKLEVPKIFKEQEEYFRDIEVTFYYGKPVLKGELGSYYEYNNQLEYNASDITGFKGGESYIFGIVFQDKYGQWTSAIPIGTFKNSLYPYDKDELYYPVKVFVQLNSGNYGDNIKQIVEQYGFKNTKIVVADINNRSVFYQGVVNPTIYGKERFDKEIYAQSSWFFRPLLTNINNADEQSETYVELKRYLPQNTQDGLILNPIKEDSKILDYGHGEIQGANCFKLYNKPIEDKNSFSQRDKFVDWSILTFDSPDITFFDSLNLKDINLKMRIVGILPITSSQCLRKVTLSSSPTSNGDFIYPELNTYNIDYSSYKKSLGDYIFRDAQSCCAIGAKSDNSGSIFNEWTGNYMIYPWETNDSIKGGDIRGLTYEDFIKDIYSSQNPVPALLDKNITVHLKQSVKTAFLTSPSNYSYDACFNIYENDSNPIRVKDPFKVTELYMGEMNKTLGDNPIAFPTVTKVEGIPASLAKTFSNKMHCFRTKDVDMRYKSSRHGVLSILSDTQDSINILPNVPTDNTPYTLIDEAIDDSTLEYIPFSDVSSNPNIPNNLQPGYWTYTDPSAMIASFRYFYFNKNDYDYAIGSLVLIKVSIVVEGNYHTIEHLGIVSTLSDNVFNCMVIEDLFYPGNSNMDKLFTSTSFVTPVNTAISDWNSSSAIPAADTNPWDKPLYIDGFSYKITKYYKWDLPVPRFFRVVFTMDIRTDFTNAGSDSIEDSRCMLRFLTMDRHSIYSNYSECNEVTEEVITELENYDILQKSLAINEQSFINLPTLTDDFGYMYLVELYNDNLPEVDITNNTSSWHPVSEYIHISDEGYAITADALIGDTYYQRYDCLKTYPYAFSDKNQLTEIFSFMCESRVNQEGRYDNKRKLVSDSIIGETFNLGNEVYTQQDNFFTSYYLDDEYFDVDLFPNQVIYSLSKTYGEEIDSWTKVLPSSFLDLDGNLGQITSLNLWNNQLICFQDKGIARILYDEKTALTTTDGTPVEIANSGKVQGKEYLSNTIGCSNKYSIQATNTGLFFVDSNKREFYQYGESLLPLSKIKGFNTYFQNKDIEINNIRTFYDNNLKDIYIKTTTNNKTECLVYNELIGEFTSFFDYKMDFMFNYKDSLVSIEDNDLWKQFEGEYLKFGNNKKYSNYYIEFISNENPLNDKIFTNVEFRADVLNGNITDVSQHTEPTLNTSVNKVPFKTIRVWNEYQDTQEVDFIKVLRKGTNFSQKYRIWRGDIGRDTLDYQHKFNRIRSPWARINLNGGGENQKTVIHDVGINYV